MEGSNPRPQAVVTGASSAIGLELAGIFVEEGHDLLTWRRTAGTPPSAPEKEKEKAE